MAVASPSDLFLETESAQVAAAPLPEPQRTDLRVRPPAELVPAAITVEIWQEDEDGSWAAAIPILGLTAIADTQADLYAEAADVVEEFWARLNGSFATLSPHLREVLELRHLPLLFQPAA
jgi:hypothetical protein